ncbi:thioredoxin domain-containing protein [Waterburya agarophytonicola K14]|uniref:Thioredoxin domain-containing protein n=1 Tax=Waterburya agarophytonicola KI4 TaxID=2874699 RepID=A0A964BUV7_9CYAN|nr:thioredoxin domain-containing protein [Waterburya agarophytonicola]MCC0178562.1 thioredoxin domain-containing protein [Waterburya agarophytonicola KI4]
MANHLASSQSLYLRKHAENPIDWWYWCEEALELAKRDNKPIFLSIGYSSCHWCTVMEGEAFSDRAIADYLNDNFVPIKVDREERPDIDSIYMQALQMMTGQGGWPLNIFLNPEDLVPFYGGTYFPVQPKYGRPGFGEILQAIRGFYDREPEKLTAFKTEIMSNLQQSASFPVNREDILTKELLYRGIEVNSAAIQPNDPGRPNFPMIPYATISLRGSRLKHEYQYNPQDLSQQRGLDLVMGGIYDHVAGGFHRYTVDNCWTVPHFEKMLYDNGQILEYLADLWSSGVRQPAIKRAIAGTVSWLQREMTHDRGYFYAAQDADNFTSPEEAEPEEGAFYVWSYRELESRLSATELAQLEQEFDITRNGNFEGNIVLQRSKSDVLSDDLEGALNKLFELRYGKSDSEIAVFAPAKNNREAKNTNWLGRIPPVTDTKAIAAWNSLTISGLARAYGVFQERAYLDLAGKAVKFILDNQWLEGRFQRLNYNGVVTVPAQSEDYAFLIKALLDLHHACPGDSQWLEEALKVQNEFDELLWSIETGGYYNNSKDGGKELLVRERSYMDNATPSPNGIAIANLVRLALLTDNLEYRDRAELGLQAFGTVMEKSPTACPSLFVALDWFLHGTSIKTSQENIEQLGNKYLPTTVFRVTTDLPEGSIALVCQGSSCLEPAISLEQVLAQVQSVV